MKFTQLEKLVLYFLSLLTLFVFYPFLFTGFTNFDQIEYYTTANQSFSYIIEESIRYAKNSGRFYLLITMPFHFLIYSIKSIVFIKFIHLLLVGLNFSLFSYFISKLSNTKWMGYTTYLILILFVSASGENNIIVGYPIYFSFSCFLLEVAFLFVIKPIEIQKKHLVYSSILFFITILFYEIYLLYLPLLGLILFYRNPTNLNLFNRVKKTFYTLIPHILVVIIYLILYITFRFYVDTGTYDGSQLNPDLNISVFIHVISNIAEGAYPLHYFFSNRSVLYVENLLLENHKQDFLYLLYVCKIEWYIFSFLFTSCIYLILKELKNYIFSTQYIIYIVIGFIYIYVPHFLLGISLKYAYAVDNWGTDNYLTNYYSSFAIAFLIGSIFCWVYLKIKSILFRIVLLFCIYLSSLLNIYSNFHATEDLKDTFLLTQSIDLLKKTNTFQDIDKNATIFCPQLYQKNSISNISYSNYDWSKYMNLFTSKNIEITTNLPKKNPSNIYYLRIGMNKKHSEIFYVFSKIKHMDSLNYYSDTAHVFYYSPIKNFNIYANKTSIDEPIYLNQTKIVSKNTFIDTPINEIDSNKPMIETTLIGKELILNSIHIHQNIYTTR